MAIVKKKQKKQKKLNLLAMDIGSSSIKLVAGIQQGDKLRVSHVFTQPLPEECYSNGVILNAFALKSAIQTAVATNGIKLKDVVLTIESTELIKREMVIALVDPEDRMSLIAYEVGQYLPIDINAYVLQYKEVETFKDEGVDKMRILLGAMPKEMVKAHYELIVACGLNPVFMDMHSNSLEKIIQVSTDQTLYPAKRSIAYIDFGYSIIDITIVENGHYKFNRLLKMGSGELDKVLSGIFEINQSDAEKLMIKTEALTLYKTINTLQESDLTTEQGMNNRIIGETVHFFTDCVVEIDKVFKYYTSRSADNHIEQVVLYGGSAEFKEITTFFNDKLDIQTDLMKKINNVDFLCRYNQEDLPRYINALGALIRR